MKTNQETLALAAATGRVVDFTPGQWAAKRMALTGRVLAAVPANAITGATAKEASANAQQWVRENIKAPAHTVIGEVLITAEGIRDSLSGKHGLYQNKLDAIPALSGVLENGVYLGEAPGTGGGHIGNHYFGGKITIGGKEQLVFVRTRQAPGNPNRFYVHQVFTEDETKKKSAYLKRVAEVNPGGLADLRNAHEIYGLIIGQLFADAHNITPDFDLSNDNPATAAPSTDCEQYDPMRDAAISATIDEMCGKLEGDAPRPGPPGRDESRGGLGR